MSPELLAPLCKQAEKIARGDQDLSQNLIAMSYQNYCSTLQNRKKELTIAELTNFMKNRSKELKCGKRHYFGNGGAHSRKDVFNKLNYYNGEVEIHHIDYSDENGNSEDPFNGKGAITAATSVRNLADFVLFKVSFEDFLGQMDFKNREIIELTLAGYTRREISKLTKLDYSCVLKRIKKVGQEFVLFFELPEQYLNTFGLQN